jgi:hypothetical protein
MAIIIVLEVADDFHFFEINPGALHSRVTLSFFSYPEYCRYKVLREFMHPA